MDNNEEILNCITQSFELKRQGYYKQAIEMLYKALSIENSNIEILSQLGELYFLLENNERALQYIERTLAIDPKHVDCLKLLRKIYLAEKKYDKVNEVSKTLFEISKTPTTAVAYLNSLNLVGDYAAIDEFVVDDELKDEYVYFELAKASNSRKNTEKTLEYLKAAVQLAPKNIEILTFLGELFYRKSDLMNAESVFETIAKIEKTDKCMFYFGLFALEAEKFEESISYFQKAVALNPSNSEYIFNLANAYYLNGWIDEAVSFFKTAIAREPENVEYIYALAYLYYRNNEFDKAKSQADKILKVMQDYVPAKVLLALIKLQTGDVLGAQLDLEKCVTLESDDDFALFALAKIYLELGMYDKARTYMEKVLTLRCDSLEYMCEYVNLLLEENKLDFAKDLIEKILEINAYYYDAWALKAKYIYSLGDCMQLFDVAQKLIELDTNRYEGYYYNALALFESEDISFAIESLKKAISIDVNNASLYVLMGEFYQAIGQNDSALLYLGEAMNIDNSAKNQELYRKLLTIVRHERQNAKQN